MVNNINHPEVQRSRPDRIKTACNTPDIHVTLSGKVMVSAALDNDIIGAGQFKMFYRRTSWALFRRFRGDKNRDPGSAGPSFAFNRFASGTGLYSWP